jgi:hypothetical protein
MMTQEHLNKLKACTDALVEQWDELQAGIDFNVEAELPDTSVPWFDEERRDVLRQATCLVYLSALDLACYPLSESSVIFFEP